VGVLLDNILKSTPDPAKLNRSHEVAVVKMMALEYDEEYEDEGGD
jgi:hypothetical protein